MTRPAATLTAFATLVLFAGCGGGSTNKSAGTKAQGGPIPIPAKEGEFRTVIPRGYTNNPSVAQYWARGPEAEDGLAINLIVVRQAVPKAVDLKTFADGTLGSFSHRAGRGSHLEQLSVDGEPAVAADYFVTASGTLKGRKTHVRQVWVKHGPWVFFIRDIAPPVQYAASLGALGEVLAKWHWQ